LEQAEQGVMQRVSTLRQAGLLDNDLNPVIPTRQQVAQHVTEQTGMDENDPLFGPLVRQTQAQAAKQAAEITELRQQVQRIATATQQAVKGYLGDNYHSTFQREVAALPESIRGKVTLEQAVNFATERKLTDDVGRLDIASAVDRLTWDARKEADKAELVKSGERLAEDKKALASMSRPGINGPRVADTGFKTTDDKGHTLSLDDAIAAASQDDQIWASAAQYMN
jgi:hypothetical protein